MRQYKPDLDNLKWRKGASYPAVVETSNHHDVAYLVSRDLSEQENLRLASLFSAAPELLSIAELILKEWERPTEGVLPGELIARLSQYAEEARIAINKAKGIK